MMYMSRFCKVLNTMNVVVDPTHLCPDFIQEHHALTKGDSGTITLQRETAYGHIIQAFTKDTLVPELTSIYRDKLVNELRIFWTNRIFNTPEKLYTAPTRLEVVSYLIHVPMWNALLLNCEDIFSYYWEVV